MTITRGPARERSEQALERYAISKLAEKSGIETPEIRAVRSLLRAHVERQEIGDISDEVLKAATTSKVKAFVEAQRVKMEQIRQFEAFRKGNP